MRRCLMFKILVYGGSGIISTEIVKLAINSGNSVTVVNRGKHPHFFSDDVKCITADLRNEALESLREKITENYDTVIDLISYKPTELEKLMQLSKSKCSQYIFFSSATVYSPKIGRYIESDQIGDSTWSYATNKALCEKQLAENASDFGFSYTIIRPYITYGETRIPFQFAPLEYYTIINRMKCGKCIPVFENSVKCTMTTAADFAVGAVGLIQNTDGYGKAFHITGNYEITWNDALKIEAKAFGEQCSMIPIPLSVFQNLKLSGGLNTDEVIGDKSRKMLFDNSKICKAVPSFQGTTKLEDMMPKIVEYYNRFPVARKINYAWDGRADRMLILTGQLSASQKRSLRFSSTEPYTFKEKIIYLINRYEFLFQMRKLIKRLAKPLKPPKKVHKKARFPKS